MKSLIAVIVTADRKGLDMWGARQAMFVDAYSNGLLCKCENWVYDDADEDEEEKPDLLVHEPTCNSLEIFAKLHEPKKDEE